MLLSPANSSPASRRSRRSSAAAVSGSAPPLGTVGMILLAAIWALAEYHNAGGWPTSGFSQSSGIPNVWNYWIIYPAIAWVLITAAGAWFVYGHKPVSENRDPARDRAPGRPALTLTRRWSARSPARHPCRVEVWSATRQIDLVCAPVSMP